MAMTRKGGMKMRPQDRIEAEPPVNNIQTKLEKEESLGFVSDVAGKLPPMPIEVFPEKSREAIVAIAASKGVTQDMVGAFSWRCARLASVGRERRDILGPGKNPGTCIFLSQPKPAPAKAIP